MSAKSANQELFVDLSSVNWNPIYRSIDQVFQPACRPDILYILVNEHFMIFVFELTICHETNLINWNKIKTNKSIG